MEKYSAFRDPGTGIQPFLPPVPPVGGESLAKLAFPFGIVLALARFILIVAVALIYITFVQGICLLFAPIPPLYRIITRIITSIIARVILILVGLWWIPVEIVTRKRRSNQGHDSWSPRAGDIIVSNWVSWIEILWLAFRFNPIFVLPVCEAPETIQSPPESKPISHTPTPGRRTGTGSAAISSPNRAPSVRKPIVGFQKVSLLEILHVAGHVPPYYLSAATTSLEQIRQEADKPVVVFPECTTSNGCGMLRFVDVFKGVGLPVKGYKIFLMCVRYDPPTNICPTLSHSVPSLSLNPLPHLLKLTTVLPAQSISIRLLSPSEAPSSPLFVVSEVVSNPNTEPVLSEACAVLIAQIGKMKRTGMGWEDKVAFLDFYREKRK